MKYIIELSISRFAFGYKISYLIDFFHGVTCDKGVDSLYIQTEKKKLVRAESFSLLQLSLHGN